MDAIVLGAIQGLTEFLPVSSSGHLTLGQAALGWSKPNLLFDIVVHAGTLVAVIGVFRREVMQTVSGALRGARGTLRGGGVAAWMDDPPARLAALVFIATCPTALIGLLLGRRLSEATASTEVVGVILILNGFLLLGTRWVGPRAKNYGGEGVPKVTPVREAVGRALLIGLGQGLAVIRGLSRSGTTIALGLMAGMDRDEAARFSFLLSIPAILGALLLEFDVSAVAATGGLWVYATGFAISALVGWLALLALLAIVRRGALHYFAPYCWLAGGAALYFFSGGPTG